MNKKIMSLKSVIFLLEKEEWRTISGTDYHECCVSDLSNPRELACKTILMKIRGQMKG